MTNIEALKLRLGEVKGKRERLGEALEAANEAYEAIRALHEQALREQNDLMAELVAEMRK